MPHTEHASTCFSLFPTTLAFVHSPFHTRIELSSVIVYIDRSYPHPIRSLYVCASYSYSFPFCSLFLFLYHHTSSLYSIFAHHHNEYTLTRRHTHTLSHSRSHVHRSYILLISHQSTTTWWWSTQLGFRRISFQQAKGLKDIPLIQSKGVWWGCGAMDPSVSRAGTFARPAHTQKVGLLRVTAKDSSGKASSSTRPKKIGQAGTRKNYKIDEEVIGSPPPSKVRSDQNRDNHVHQVIQSTYEDTTAAAVMAVKCAGHLERENKGRTKTMVVADVRHRRR